MSASLRPGTRFLFRADASQHIGGGHVMRCLALADKLRERGAEVTFACALLSDSLATRIRGAGHRLYLLEPVDELVASASNCDGAVLSDEAQHEDANRLVRVAGDVDWVVVDHYRLDACWLEAIGGHASRLVLDDLANRRQSCELLVDPTLGRQAADYHGLVPEQSRIMTGPQYALLRPEFSAARDAALERREEPGPLRKILISLGLSDVGGVSAAALNAVRSAGFPLQIDLVVGSQTPSLPALEAMSAEDPDIRLHVDAQDMAGLIAKADLAIGAAGTSSWERCCLGLPTISLTLADNQRLVAEGLARAGAILVAESPEAITALLRRLKDDPQALPTMTAAAAAITDGCGTDRVANAIVLLQSPPSAGTRRPIIRPATLDDSRHAWVWRNDWATRSSSRNSDPVTWADHQAWWRRALDSPERRLFIAEVAGMPMAVVRFDRLPDAIEVSINLAPSARGIGLGGPILQAACSGFSNSPWSGPLLAAIHRDNAASRKIFERAGFTCAAVATANSPFLQYRRP